MESEGGGTEGSGSVSVSLSSPVEPSCASTMVPNGRLGSPHNGEVTGSSSYVNTPISPFWPQLALLDVVTAPESQKNRMNRYIGLCW